VTRPLRWASARRSLLVAALAALAGGAAVASAGHRLTTLLDLDLPRWVHNLADMLQIATALIALLVWEAGRRARH